MHIKQNVKSDYLQNKYASAIQVYLTVNSVPPFARRIGDRV